MIKFCVTLTTNNYSDLTTNYSHIIEDVQRMRRRVRRVANGGVHAGGLSRGARGGRLN